MVTTTHDEKTTFGDLHQTATKVYRITTQSSKYLLGIYAQGGRRSVVRGEPGSDKQHVIVRDSEPRIGERSLWDVAAEEWSGHVLEAGTMLTSRIQSVTEAGDAKTRALFANAQLSDASDDENEQTVFRTPRPRPRESRQKRETRQIPSYPESHVEHAETAAMYLRAVERASSLFDDVAGDDLLEERLRVALAGCAVAFDGIRRRVEKRQKR